MNLAALVGLRIFLQLEPDDQNAALLPLLSCCEVQKDETWHPVIVHEAISPAVRDLVAEMSQVVGQELERFPAPSQPA